MITNELYMITTVDGRDRVIATYAVPLYKDGKVNGVVGLWHDITELKLAEKDLRETRDYLESLINYANAPIIVWDPGFTITRFNHAFEWLSGYAASEVLGKSLSVLFPPDSIDESLSKIGKTLTGEYWDSVEIPILHKDGSIRIALWNSANINGTDNALVATIAQGQDITERKRIEAVIKQSEAQFRALIQNLESGIALVDDRGRFAVVNPAFLKMFGLADVVPDRAPQKGDSAEKSRLQAVKVESLDKNVRFSGVDGEELSRAVIKAHGKMFGDILEHRASDDSYVPVTMSTIPLVRMSRRLVGAYTMDDLESRVHMPDSIGMTGDWRRRGPAYEIPFGTLCCREVPNLLAAGRDISVTDAMWDITRVIPPCAVTGEAAGTAAAMGDDFPALDVAALQRRLEAQGVRLHGSW
jgi:PAS domain S-box-containing protein